MKVDINDEEYLKKLRKAVASEEGQIVIDFIKSKVDEIKYDNIQEDRPDNEVGQDFKVYKRINDFINGILGYFASLIKN